MKHLALDSRYVALENTGLGRFAFFLTRSILKYKSDDLHLVVILNKSTNSLTETLKKLVDNTCNSEIYYTNTLPFTLRSLFFFFIEANRLKCDSYLHPHFDLPLFIRGKKFVYIHDLFPLLVDKYIVRHESIKKLYFAFKIFYCTYVSSAVFTISETTKQDILRLWFVGKQRDICVTYLASTIDETVVMTPLSLPNNYIVYVGDRRPHKNLLRIIELFKLMKGAGYGGALLLVGSTKNFDVNIDHFLNKDIVAVGIVTDEELVYIYRNCDALIFLSKYEGFGLPVVECASFGKRVIISDGGSLTEVKPTWGYLIPNMDELELHLDSTISYLINPIEIDESYQSKFSWEKLAIDVIGKIYEA